MALVQTADIVWLGAVTLIAAYQMARFARRVGNSRRKYKIDPPAVTGDPEFVRTFRAQQNCLEFFGIFMCCLWTTGIFFHQIPAALIGLYYCYGREKYFNGYVQDAKLRIPGFKLCVQALQGFLALAIVGVTHNILLLYLGIDLRTLILG